MQYTHLGRSGLPVSRLCLGTMNFGPQTERLQTDYIDVYQFHHVDRDTPWDEIWLAIEVAVQQGKIQYSTPNALNVNLDAATLTRLDEIFPGHKTIPEDYAR